MKFIHRYLIKIIGKYVTNSLLQVYKSWYCYTGLSMAQMSLAWVKSRWFSGSAIIGATTIEQLKENIGKHFNRIMTV
jgi:aryl-alcohol dehydrogenase-like predicted oxidoreductase